MRAWLIVPIVLAACTPESHDSAGPTDTGVAAEICGDDAAVGLEVADCAPDFALLDRYGETFTLFSMRGKVTLVDISAVW